MGWNHGCEMKMVLYMEVLRLMWCGEGWRLLLVARICKVKSEERMSYEMLDES